MFKLQIKTQFFEGANSHEFPLFIVFYGYPRDEITRTVPKLYLGVEKVSLLVFDEENQQVLWVKDMEGKITGGTKLLH